jgi:hypothetical protein
MPFLPTARSAVGLVITFSLFHSINLWGFWHFIIWPFGHFDISRQRVIWDPDMRPPFGTPIWDPHDAARRCTTLHAAARRCSTLPYAARRCSTLLDAARRCSTLLDAARLCSTLLDVTRLGRETWPGDLAAQWGKWPFLRQIKNGHFGF